MSWTSLTLTNLSPTTSSLSEPITPTSDSPTNPQARKFRPSPQLNRWHRARAIRSGRKLDRPVQPPTPDVSPVHFKDFSDSDVALSPRTNNGYLSNEDDEGEMMSGGKAIYMVSDGTGWTAEHAVSAALGQFDYCLVDRGCSVNTHLFSGIDDVERLVEVVKQAAKEGAILVYTLADPAMAESAKQACNLWGVTSTDILGPITEAVANHLGVSPSGLPRWAPGRTNSLSEDYFRRIEAMEFTIKQDDGALPGNLHKADIILAGVSRTGKTPLSIYLSQKGYKVANVPIVMNLKLPEALFEVDPQRVFALTINPVILQTIRRARAKSLGFNDELKNNYSEMDYVKQDLEFAGKIFAQNPVWPVIEVTGKAIEETAAIVLRLYHDRKNKCSMPRISKRY
ncbi:hypothetical protein Leryth_008719 [Lithospermum erythrorhizon]|nr:hypothetical protein Leryth_008719 [Lithospermum erythrorhizon]